VCLGDRELAVQVLQQPVFILRRMNSILRVHKAGPARARAGN
jgi:hypothetical protein